MKRLLTLILLVAVAVACEKQDLEEVTLPELKFGKLVSSSTELEFSDFVPTTGKLEPVYRSRIRIRIDGYEVINEWVEGNAQEVRNQILAFEFEPLSYGQHSVAVTSHGPASREYSRLAPVETITYVDIQEEETEITLGFEPWDFYINSITINHNERVESVEHNIETGYWQESRAHFEFKVTDIYGTVHENTVSPVVNRGTSYSLTYNFNKTEEIVVPDDAPSHEGWTFIGTDENGHYLYEYDADTRYQVRYDPTIDGFYITKNGSAIHAGVLTWGFSYVDQTTETHVDSTD